MHLPEPNSYREKVLFALARAVTEASADHETRTVTYRATEAAEACLSMAALLLNAKPDHASVPSTDEVAKIVADKFTEAHAALSLNLPGAPLDAELPGYVTFTLA